jgi:hypothetical protein
MRRDLAGGDFRVRVISRAKIHGTFVQIGLVGLFLGQPKCGSGAAPLRIRAFALFLWRTTQLMPTDPAWRASFYFAHQLGVCLLAVLVAGHAAVSLFRHFIRRGDVLRGIAPALTRQQHEQHLRSYRDPMRSMNKMAVVVAASLALGTATMVTVTVAFARGCGDMGDFDGVQFGGDYGPPAASAVVASASQRPMDTLKTVTEDQVMHA